MRALSDVDLELRRGQSVALLGPNGAGKTTLLSILAGVGRAGSGTLAWADGVEPRVGWVPQRPALYQRLSVRENLRLFAALEERGDAAAAAESLISRADLGAVADQLASRLSTGTLQRLNLAIALAGRPSVLLLDEPTATLSPDQRLRLWRWLDELRAEEGVALLFSTQSVNEAAAPRRPPDRARRAAGWPSRARPRRWSPHTAPPQTGAPRLAEARLHAPAGAIGLRAAALIFRKDLRLLGRSPAVLLLVVVYPILVALLVAVALQNEDHRPRVAVVNLDPSGRSVEVGGRRLSVDDYVQRLAEDVDVSRLDPRAADDALSAGRVGAVITIPAHFIADLQSGVRQPVILLATSRRSPIEADQIRQSLEAALYRLNQRLAVGYVDSVLRLVDLVVNGGRIGFFGRSGDALGLRRSRVLVLTMQQAPARGRRDPLRRPARPAPELHRRDPEQPRPGQARGQRDPGPDRAAHGRCREGPRAALGVRVRRRPAGEPGPRRDPPRRVRDVDRARGDHAHAAGARAGLALVPGGREDRLHGVGLRRGRADPARRRRRPHRPRGGALGPLGRHGASGGSRVRRVRGRGGGPGPRGAHGPAGGADDRPAADRPERPAGRPPRRRSARSSRSAPPSTPSRRCSWSPPSRVPTSHAPSVSSR